MPPDRSVAGRFVGFVWSAERDNTLKNLRNEGLGFIKCGSVLGVSEHAVRKRAKAIGLPLRIKNLASWRGHGAAVWNDEERAIAAKLYRRGWGCGRIGHKISKSRGAVTFELQRQGIYGGDRRGHFAVEQSDKVHRAKMISDDLKFQAAMQAAIDAGLERP